MNIDNLQTQPPITENINVVDYPSAGTSETTGCGSATPVSFTKTVAINRLSSSSTSGVASYLRVNSFSSCKMPDNTALVAVASQDVGVESLAPTTDEDEIARRMASRVHIISTPLGTNYASSVRRATIVALNQEATADCRQGSVDVQLDVDSDIWSDTKLDTIWPLDGDLAGIKFKIITRLSENIWRILPQDTNKEIDLTIGHCLRFIPYGSRNYTYPNSLNSISPLPYIEVDGVAVPSVNPQIASNSFLSPTTSPYVYVIAEAPVNGAYQLFFYSFKVTANFELFGWRQLTFDGENRNARMKVDRYNNLHVTWESSRAKPNQVFYGVIGPSSRAAMNETFISAVDKQIAAGELNSGDMSAVLVNIADPLSLDLREIDEYGEFVGSTQWTEIEANGGSATVIAEDTITVSGNPRSQKFATFAILQRDENDVYFDGNFSQLSYQLSFDMTLSAATEDFTVTDIEDEFIVWKQAFTPSSASSSTNVNVYEKDGNYYTLDDPKTVYENIIPFAGSYKNNNEEQLSLRHYMLVAVPEKVRFTAKSTQNLSDEREEHYTGRFKLGMIFETSANISDRKLAYQKHHWVRLFGDPIKFGEDHNYKIAVHYSHLREEGVSQRQQVDTIEGYEQNVRFSGNVIVVVDGAPAVSESFVPDFADQYHQFDIALGCTTVSEFRTLSLNPYDGSTNDDISVTMSFDGIKIGPHSVVANDCVTSFAKTDRNVSRMVIVSDADELESLTAAQEAWGTQSQYLLSLGLRREKFSLSQVPITFKGRNQSPNLALDACSKPHITYQSNRNGNWEIYYSAAIDSGIPFRFDTKITESEGNSLNPSIGIDNENRRLITWHDNRNGVYQIYAARSSERFGCFEDICTLESLSNLRPSPSEADWHFEEYGEYGEYASHIEDTGGACRLSFRFTNNSDISKKYHFIANFYTDSALTSFYKDVDSRLDISHWTVNGEQIDYEGVTVDAGESIDATYIVSKEDDLSGELYYVEIEVDDSSTVSTMENTLIYFCPIQQGPKCTIPAIYVNLTDSQITVHFRVTIYRDELLSEAVLSTSTEDDVTRWVKGVGSFPPSGLSVNGGDTISVVYNPEFVTIEQSEKRDSSVITTLLCNVKYWVVIESLVDSVYDEIDTYAILCSCDEIKTHIWREDTQSAGWICSGQGSQDIRLTSTGAHALFPEVDASEDGIIYVAWEDRRFAKNQDANGHYIYYCIWDARTDIFYSSAQGFRDREVSAYNRFRPVLLVNNMQHVSFVCSDGNLIYTKTCSLYREPIQMSSSSSSSSSFYGEQGVFNENLLELSTDDVTNCISAKVYDDDVIDHYHKDSGIPIALINECKIRFEILGPSGSYAVRFRNENTQIWSDWLNVLPKLPNYPISSSSSGYKDRAYLEGYAIGDNRFVVPWVLSRGNGTKRVYVQVLTYSGVTPEFYVDAIARYKEIKHKIEFFRDSAFTMAASEYKGTPVVSTKALTISDRDATSLLSVPLSSSTIYIKVTFDDVERLERLLDVGKMERFGGDGNLTFSVYTQGFNSSNNTLTKISDGIYTGEFEIATEDGIDNKDGLAVVTVNIPTPCENAMSSSSATCARQFTSPNEIKLMKAMEVQDSKIYNEKFRLKYNREILCTFTSNSNCDGTETFTEEDDDISDHEPPQYAGSVGCRNFSWTSPQMAEKFFYLPNGGQNATDWVVISQPFELDFSDSRIDYLKFGGTSKLDDIAFLIRADETVTATISNSGSSSSSGNSGGPAQYKATFVLPQGSIVLSATNGYYCHGPADCNNGSAAKTFYVGAVNVINKIGDVPAGTSVNDGNGNIAMFTVPWAFGYNDSPLASSSSSHISNALKTTFSVGVSKNELQARGFITGNGILRFKLVHVISGTGFANIDGITCGATCFDLSSSSSGA